jgi:hypothetical protein
VIDDGGCGPVQGEGRASALLLGGTNPREREHVCAYYKVWTQRVGDGKIKLLLLHGGPGGSSEGIDFVERIHL